MIYDLIGWSVVILFTVSWFPQMLHTYKLKTTRDLSFSAILLNVIASALGCVFTLHNQQPILFVGYMLSLLCSVVLTGMYMVYKK